jgi:hypothetical protein
MEGQSVKSKKGKQTKGQPEVVCNFSYSKETTPALRRLLCRLLQPREANTSKEEKEAENER